MDDSTHEVNPPPHTERDWPGEDEARDLEAHQLDALERANRPEPPPHDSAAEAALLGAMLASEKARDVVGNLTADDFYTPNHGHIFAAVTALHEKAETVDPVTVAAELGGLLDIVGGPAELVSLHANTPTTAGAATYARIVGSCSRRRQQIHAAADLIAAARRGQPTTDALGALEDLEGAGSGAHAVRLGDTLGQYLDLLEDRVSGAVTNGISTGMIDLDAEIGGLRPSELITVAARPGVGKSDFGGQIAINTTGAGHTTLVVSVEMGLTQLQDRWVASVSSFRHGLLRSGDIAEKDWSRITDGMAKLGPLPLYVQDDPSATLATIRHQARRIPDLGLIIVDYLQLMESVGKHESRQTEVAALSKGLKRLSRDMALPVIALAQLNRGVEARLDKRPLLSDLRESGAIEQDSDIVIGLYRDELYNPDSTDKGTMEAIILKNRAGATGKVRLAYLAHLSQIYSMARGA